MSSLRRQIATSDAAWASAARSAYRGARSFGLPIPHPIAKLAVVVFEAVRGLIYAVRRVVIAEPLFKGYCASYGRNLTTGVFVHFVQGAGAIEVGDDVTVDGKSSFLFAARFSERPLLKIGSRTGIGHACTFTVGKRIEIGEDCRIAGNVWMFDSPGHPSDPVARLTGAPPDADQVRPITIGRNVWIGGHSIIFPGVTIGEGSVVAAGSVVTADVAAGVVVAGNPARRIAALTPVSPVTARPAGQSIPDIPATHSGGPIGG